MSRVYEALQWAEEEKKGNRVKKFPVKAPEKKPLPGEERPTLKFPKKRTEEPELSPKEDAPVLTIRPETFAAEEFRKLKTQIFLYSPGPLHSLLITSAVPREGKTMVAFNLALAISREFHKKVILIDADLRKPSIHLEAYPKPKGLSNYLLNQASLSEILLDSGAQNLQIIPAGDSSRKSAELIGTAKMSELLGSLRKLGDDTYIIIDSPPIISAAESTLLSKMVDGVILVVTGCRTPKESVRRAVESIDRQKLIGTVFNEVDIKPSSYYSKSYYGFYKKHT
ncbi:MAG TPA: CpsD/CapB family tyrosine-protein kinase [Thermodesulfobacteriota bacterium]|nr:CpsD/CapB family tyrosine-protein kinase [Thermodesulfobacteriota bacterium]